MVPRREYPKSCKKASTILQLFKEYSLEGWAELPQTKFAGSQASSGASRPKSLVEPEKPSTKEKKGFSKKTKTGLEGRYVMNPKSS